jgi:hypothetical protein
MSKTSKGRAKRRARSGTCKPRIPRLPAEIKAYSGSGFHTPGKYGTAERRSARREIERERD